MESNDYTKISKRCYACLTDGTPYGLILNEDRIPVGVLIVTSGLNALKKHCFDPRNYRWTTLGTIEQKRQEIIGERGRWNDIPLLARHNPWQIVCMALTKEHEVFAKDMVNNYCEDIKTYISEEE